ncbi:hypothetical protein CWI38_0304p0030 [Hamiltosporidium tvaerminnensis]|uniref:Uncharacterized protein n=1 Tax=Hamiltosporidium tvaerminnensis TaxID=1176355 RepID=A0A4Q9M122_9MICR|nr:hypothetical protein CWI38_0304p0030 [Hamiltosporidium tvaerminnensis]
MLKKERYTPEDYMYLEMKILNPIYYVSKGNTLTFTVAYVLLFFIFYTLFLLYYIGIVCFFIVKFECEEVYTVLKKYFVLVNLFTPHIVHHIMFMYKDHDITFLKLSIYNISVLICILSEICIYKNNSLNQEKILPIIIVFIYQIIRLILSFKYFGDFIFFIFKFEQQTVRNTFIFFLKFIMFFIIDAFFKPFLFNSFSEIFFLQSIFLVFKILYVAIFIRKTKYILNCIFGVIFYILLNFIFEWNILQLIFDKKKPLII